MMPLARCAAAAGAAFVFSHVGMGLYAPALETHAGAAVLLAIDAAALLLGVWAAKSSSLVALVGCAVVAPALLWLRVPEAGGWWHLIAIYKFTVLAVCGWWGWFGEARREEKRSSLTWAGAVLPTVCAAGALFFVFVRF